MQKKLVNFIAALRSHDIRISTSESLDAMRALALVGYENRAQLKQALAATLAKTIDEKSSFDHCFELFYNGTRLQIETQENKAPNTANPPFSSTVNIAETIANDSTLQQAVNQPLVQMLLSDNFKQLATLVAQTGTELDTENLRHYTQTGQYTQQLLKSLGSDSINHSIRDLQAINSPNADFIVDILKNKKQQLRDLAKQNIEEVYLLTAKAEGRQLQEHVMKHAQLSAVDAHYTSQLQELVRKLAKKLAAKHSARQQVDRRGKLNVAKTLHKNIQHDGILFDTYWKKKRKDQPKVIALCDVSNSVSAYAKFLLLFLYSLNDVLPKVRSFCFSNRCGEVTDLFDLLPPQQAIAQAFQQWGLGSSDYGRSLNDFAKTALEKIDNNTTVIIIGDGRNNHGEANLSTLKDIYNRARTVIWLNPERRSSWYSGDSEMRRYQTACHFVSQCQSLQQLNKVVDQLLKLIK